MLDEVSLEDMRFRELDRALGDGHLQLHFCWILAHLAGLTLSSATQQALLDEVSLEDMRFRDLDKALGDAMRMMRVSNVRVRKLRKMHAMVLLHQ